MQGILQERWKGNFNYSAINNYAVREAAKGEYILLLNNDTEVITPSWIEEMLMFAQREDVGAVGAKLYYPDDTIQHAGVILGKRGIAGRAYQRGSKLNFGYMGRLSYAQSRGPEDTSEKQTRFASEVELFRSRWEEELKKVDPYYNPNLSLDGADFYPKNRR